MPQHIVLLCPPGDAAYLATILNLCNPALTISSAPDRAALDRCLAAAPGDVRLVAFCTPVIVPPHHLERLPGPAYNFHPGSPAYPGKFPAPFALYDHAPRFGATAHEMVAKVDSGPIVGAVEFMVPPGADLAWLGERARRATFSLFLSLASALATSATPLPRLPLTWSGRPCSEKALLALCALPPDIAEPELARRVAAFGQVGGIRFHFPFHGYRAELALGGAPV